MTQEYYVFYNKSVIGKIKATDESVKYIAFEYAANEFVKRDAVELFDATKILYYAAKDLTYYKN